MVGLRRLWVISSESLSLGSYKSPLYLAIHQVLGVQRRGHFHKKKVSSIKAQLMLKQRQFNIIQHHPAHYTLSLRLCSLDPRLNPFCIYTATLGATRTQRWTARSLYCGGGPLGKSRPSALACKGLRQFLLSVSGGRTLEEAFHIHLNQTSKHFLSLSLYQFFLFHCIFSLSLSFFLSF